MSDVLSEGAYLDGHVVADRGDFTLDAEVCARAGQVVALLGPNGSGKTTALHALAGLIPVRDGHVRVAGQQWADGRRQREASERHTGLVVADHLLFPHLTVLANVAFGPRSRGQSRASATARARAELAALGIADFADRRPRELSNGQAQRVALARALATDPALLLLDEPLAALDPDTRSLVRATLHHRLASFAGATVLVTHDPLDALTLADELVFLDAGRVVQRGTPAEVIARPRTPYVAQVVGLNLYAGHALDGTTVQTSWGRVVAAPHEHRGESWVAFAPSAVALYPARPEGSPRNTWELLVVGVEVAGQRARVHLQPLGMPGVSLASEVTVASVVALGLAPGVRVWGTVKAAEVTAYPA